MINVGAAASVAALVYVGWTMVRKDIQAERGIFRSDHMTTDAVDAAKMAAGDDVDEKPSWVQQLRKRAAAFAAERNRSTAGMVQEDVSSATLPRAVLTFAVEQKAEDGSPAPPELPGGGEVELLLRSDIAPRTVENFTALCSGELGTISLVSRATDSSGKHVRRKVRMAYEGAPVHRIVPGFCIQSGDITNGDGTGGRSVFGPRFDDENFLLKHAGPGALAMANRGPGTNSSQFYITLGRAPWLDGKHVVFGRVVRGMDVLRTLETLGSESGVPAARVVIKAAAVHQPGEPVRQ